MKTKLARPKTRKLPRISPAIHFLRPVFLIIAGLLTYGIYHGNACAATAAGALAFVTVLPALALHSDYRAKHEQRKEIACG